jgi:hypothetical protein
VTIACSPPETLTQYLDSSNNPEWAGWRLCAEIERIISYGQLGYMAQIIVPDGVQFAAKEYLARHRDAGKLLPHLSR